MTHRLTNITAKTAVCSQCGEVKVYRASKLSKPVCWEWQKEKNKAVRMKATKQAVRNRKSAKVKLQREAEALWRLIVFERAGRCCELCGKGPYERGDFQLQAHHAIKRAQSARLRLDPQNGIALDAGCHQWADRDPVGCIAKVERIDTGITEYLFSERRLNGRIPFEDEVKRLFSVAWLYGIKEEQTAKEFPSLHTMMYTS